MSTVIRTATTAQLATKAVTLLSMYFVAGSATGSVRLFDGTATTAPKRVHVDTPAATGAQGGAGSTLDFKGGGVRFNTGIFGKIANSGGVTIVYAT